MSIFNYLLNFVLCHAALWGFYQLFLAQETIHTVKRYYLMMMVVVASIIPLITFPVYIVQPMVGAVTAQVEANTLAPLKPTAMTQVSRDYFWLTLVRNIYVAGVLLFGIRFLRNLARITFRIFRGNQVHSHRLTYVLIPREVMPHTFLRYIFLNLDWFKNDLIPQEVLLHEKAHAKQLHSLDLLFIELLGIFMWFNPLVYFMKNAIRLNHEFLADRYVLKQGIETSKYQRSILNLSINDPKLVFANAFHYSFIKKRFIIMKKQSKKGVIHLKVSGLVVLIGFLLFGFSGRELKVTYVQNAIMQKQSPSLDTIDPITAYNRLAKHYNAYPETDFIKKVKDMWKIRNLYESIPVSQRGQLEKYPVSTTSTIIYITNDGKYLMNEKEVSLAEIASLFEVLSPQERSNVFVFDEMKDYDDYKYGRYEMKQSRFNKRPKTNRYKIFPNDVYIYVCSQELVRPKAIKFDKIFKKTSKRVFKKQNREFGILEYAKVNKKLKLYIEQLDKIFEKYGLNTNR